MPDTSNNKQKFSAGANFAPLKPLVDLKDPKAKDKRITDEPLNRQIQGIYNEKMALHTSEWRSMVAIGQIIALFIQGEQVLTINEFTKLPRIVDANKKNPLHNKAINKMQGYCTVWQDKWRSSKPDILLAPYSNADQAVAQARKANQVADYLESKFFTPFFNLHEGLMAQVWGWYGRRVKPDFNSKTFSVFKEIFEDTEMPISKGFGKCAECGYAGDKVKKSDDENEPHHRCPECDDEKYEYEPPVMQLMPKTVGKEKVFLPEIICEQLFFPSCRWDIAKQVHESDWFITEKRVAQTALQRMIKNIRFPEGESGNEFGLDVIAALAARGAASDGQNQSADQPAKQEEHTLTEMYLGADDLHRIIIPKNTKTVEGLTLPAGKRMSELMDDALFVGVNGFSMTVGIHNDTHKTCVSGSVYHIKPMSGTGRGVADAVPIQTQYNRRYAQYDRQMAARATPPILGVEGAIEPRYQKMLSRPDAYIPVKLQNFPEVKNLQQLIAPLQGTSVDGALVGEVHDRLENMLQFAYHTTNLGGISQSGIDNDTATYAQIADSNSDAIFSPVLSLKAQCNLDTVKNGFYKFIRCTPFARFIPFSSPSKAGNIGMEISGKEIEGEYQWTYVPGSEAPKTRFSEMQKKAAFFGMWGGAGNWLMARMQSPKEVAELERDFDVNFETDSTDLLSEGCRRRFEYAKKLLDADTKQMQGFGMDMPPDYLSAIARVQPSLLIDEAHLPEKRLWFQSLLDTEEGQMMKPAERDLVATFVQVFKKLSDGQTIQLQQQAAVVQIESEKPLIEAQNQMQAEQMAGQAEAQNAQMQNEQAQNEQDQMLAVADRVAELGDKENQREHELKTSAIDAMGTLAAQEASGKS